MTDTVAANEAKMIMANDTSIVGITHLILHSPQFTRDDVKGNHFTSRHYATVMFIPTGALNDVTPVSIRNVTVCPAVIVPRVVKVNEPSVV